jgi:multiple sugar transport system ATP-binding protein
VAAVELRNVRKSFGKHDVIKGVDLDIEDGEFVVFVGPPAAANRRCSG